MPEAPGKQPADLDRLERWLTLLCLLSLSLVALGLVGEELGGSNDIGAVLISFGTVASVGTAVLAFLVNATKGQVRPVADSVERNHETLEQVAQGTQTNGAKLERLHDDLHRDLENPHDVLLQIWDRP